VAYSELLGLFPPGTDQDSDGMLRVGGCRLDELAAAHGTPALIVDETALRERAEAFQREFTSRRPGTMVTFASKAFPCTAVQRVMVAAGLGRSTFTPGIQRGRRSQTAEDAVKLLLDAGADVNAVNEADFTALHGAAFRGLDEVIEILVTRGANINARDFRGRTAYRIAEGSKQSFQFQAYPETAEFIKKLGANTALGIPGTVQERNRDLTAAAAQNQ
jgi:hypothetical protein